MKGMGLDARIGAAFLQAGLGYGGSCFPKDTDSLVHTAAALGYRFDILRAVVDVNADAGRALRVDRSSGPLAPLHTRRIAVLGLAFKPNTDDMREAKSLEVVTRLDRARRDGLRLRPGRDDARAEDAADGRRVRRTRRTRPRPAPTASRSSRSGTSSSS